MVVVPLLLGDVVPVWGAWVQPGSMHASECLVCGALEQQIWKKCASSPPGSDSAGATHALVGEGSGARVLTSCYVERVRQRFKEMVYDYAWLMPLRPCLASRLGKRL